MVPSVADPGDASNTMMKRFKRRAERAQRRYAPPNRPRSGIQPFSATTPSGADGMRWNGFANRRIAETGDVVMPELGGPRNLWS